jgi:16S rRNA (cytosine967-C5)-methyltransferase
VKISPARRAAFDVLFRIESDRAFSSVLLPQYEDKLAPNDRALCHELVLGVLRRQIYLDRQIAALTNDKKLDLPVRNSLRLGLYQLGFLDKVPHHAVVNDSVQLVLRAKLGSARSFVNAVLRRFAREQPSISVGDEIDAVTVDTSHPRWLIERWIRQYGMEFATAIATANNKRPQPTFRVIDEKVAVNPLWRIARTNGSFTALKIDDELSHLAASGRIYFQDEGSQLVAASVSIPEEGAFLDVCAAPGGKTASIARNHENTVIVAGDLHHSRVALLKQTLMKQGATDVKVVRYDAEKGLPFADGTFDSVLVDAPCTGTGTIRHNPEIRYFLTPDDPAQLSRKQQRILANASKLLKPGGQLVYSTCSLEKEEGEDIVAPFLSAHPAFSLARPEAPQEFFTAEGFVRTWPHRDGMDGFFIARLVKRRM